MTKVIKPYWKLWKYGLERFEPSHHDVSWCIIIVPLRGSDFEIHAKWLELFLHKVIAWSIDTVLRGPAQKLIDGGWVPYLMVILTEKHAINIDLPMDFGDWTPREFDDFGTYKSFLATIAGGSEEKFLSWKLHW